MSQAMKVKVFTIANDYYLPQVELLRDSLYKSEENLENQVEFQWIRLEAASESPRPWGVNADTCLERILASVSQYSITEASTAIKARMFRHYFSLGYERVIYLDPDLYFVGSIFTVLEEFKSVDCGLTPHMLSPYPDNGRRPSEIDIMGSGVYNLGFLYLRKSADTVKFVEWWAARLLTDCCETKLKGVFTDQKWCDLIPSFVQNTGISRNPGFNYAYWNMHEREIEHHDDQLLVNGVPLTFAHFSGIVSPSTGKVSKHSNRTTDYLTEDAKELYTDYYKQLEALRKTATKTWSYDIRIGFTKHNLHVIFRQALNDLFRANPSLLYKIKSKNDVLYEICHIRDGKFPAFLTSLFSQRKDVAIEYMPSILKGDIKPLLTWIKQSGSKELPGIEALPILTEDKTQAEKIHEIYAARDDLRAAYPSAFASVGAFSDFSQWIFNSLKSEYGEEVDTETLAYEIGVTGLVKLDFLLQLDSNFGTALKLEESGSAARLLAWIETDRKIFNQKERLFLRTGIRLHPKEIELRVRLRLKKLCFARNSQAWTSILAENGNSLLTNYVQRLISEETQGFNYYSYSYACSGLGVAARQLMRVLAEDNIALRKIPLPSMLDFDKAISLKDLCQAEVLLHWAPSPREINFYHANFDALDRISLNKECYNAAYPIWEIDNVPDVMRKNISRFDIVFAACEFVKNLFDSVRPGTQVLRHAAELKHDQADAKFKRRHKTVFAYFFDVASVPDRKNPYGLIDAFERAFGRNHSEAKLILKINRCEANSRFVSDLISRTIDNSAIELIFDVLDETEMLTLWNQIDVYVSLHRAEGFGLTLLEAAVRGKNLICTNYGGIATEFPSSAVDLVDYKMVRIGTNNAPYPVDGFWANPDIDCAAERMLQLQKNPRQRAAKADRLRKFATEYFADALIARQFYQGMNLMKDKFSFDEEVEESQQSTEIQQVA